jgi:hypothetical protein
MAHGDQKIEKDVEHAMREEKKGVFKLTEAIHAMLADKVIRTESEINVKGRRNKILRSNQRQESCDHM